VLVAVADPTKVVTSDDLPLALGLDVFLVVVESSELDETISRTYRRHVEVIEGDAGLLPDEEQTLAEDVREGAMTNAPAIRLCVAGI
jgi:hypothetical protein